MTIDSCKYSCIRITMQPEKWHSIVSQIQPLEGVLEDPVQYIQLIQARSETRHTNQGRDHFDVLQWPPAFTE